ncbi:MAG: hypothetical protein HQK94_14785 [Nitrospirae bacterium]|nr:hypothetical protein [Nitrospirota bacterium]
MVTDSNDNMFPLIDTGTRDGFKGTHELVENKPFGKTSLAYSLLLPKGWLMEGESYEQEAENGQIVRTGMFLENLTPDAAVVQVAYSKLSFEINVSDWVQYQMGFLHTDIIYVQHQNFACGPVVDAGGYARQLGKRLVIRMVGHADSTRIFLVMGIAIADRYEELKRNIAIAANSFKLLKPTGITFMEKRMSFIVQSPNFMVSYPASWQTRLVKTRIEGKSGLDLLWLIEGKMMAYLRVKTIDSSVTTVTNSDERKGIAMDEITEGGVLIMSPWIEDKDLSVNMVADLEDAYVSKGMLNKAQVELRLGFVKREDLIFAVTLISVPREYDPMLWMHSKRAYEIALLTATPDIQQTSTEADVSDLGSISVKYESGNRGVSTISSGVGDAGGVSYGTYQLSSTTGTLQAYLNSSGYGAQFAHLNSGTDAFNQKWKHIAASDTDFAQSQHDFIKSTHYEPLAIKVLADTGLDVSMRGRALNEAIWSTGVQYGGHTGLVSKALAGKDTANMSDAEIITVIQDYKAATVERYFKSSSDDVRAAVANRIRSEKADLLAMAQSESV